MWVTVGYFQVQKIPLSSLQNPPTQFQYGNPDGYQLVRELYSDVGEAKRNRAFFIYDRTIPRRLHARRNAERRQGHSAAADHTVVGRG